MRMRQKIKAVMKSNNIRRERKIYPSKSKTILKEAVYGVGRSLKDGMCVGYAEQKIQNE